MCKVIAVFVFLLAVSVPGITEYTAAHPPVVAAVEFGHPHTGTGLRTDASNHATDSLNPRTTIVPVGATVFFGVTANSHAIAIYDDGTTLADIDVNNKEGFAAGPCPGPPNQLRYINDSNDRLFKSDPPCTTNPLPVLPVLESFTFLNPGRYLVICRFDSHLLNADMFGWVIVK